MARVINLYDILHFEVCFLVVFSHNLNGGKISCCRVQWYLRLLLFFFINFFVQYIYIGIAEVRGVSFTAVSNQFENSTIFNQLTFC